MKKLLTALMVLLALNFLGVAGWVGWSFKSGTLSPEKVAKIKEIIFPPPAAPVASTQPSTTAPAPGKFAKLEELLAEKAGMPVGEQVEFLQRSADANRAEDDRRQRELLALKDQIELAQHKLDADRKKHVEEEQVLTNREQEANRLATDKGFQEALKLYNSLPAKQVKKMFASLDDDTVVRYLKAMEPRAATKTLKEFKTPTEVERAQKLLERMRQSEPPATQAASIKE